MGVGGSPDKPFHVRQHLVMFFQVADRVVKWCVGVALDVSGGVVNLKVLTGVGDGR